MLMEAFVHTFLDKDSQQELEKGISLNMSDIDINDIQPNDHKSSNPKVSRK